MPALNLQRKVQEVLVNFEPRAKVISIDAKTSCSIALFSSALVIFFVILVLESTTRNKSSVAVADPVIAVISDIF